MTILKGHISPETAFRVEDYPYGFRLRCQIRYWLDCHPRKGARLVSQTSNPKKPLLVWNKPKASTYQRFAGCMYLDDNGHVQWTGVNEYDTLQECIDWFNRYGEGVPDVLKPVLGAWINAKEQFNRQKAAGKAALIETVTHPDGSQTQSRIVLQPEVIRA